jgi:hypothetical protein
MRLAWGTVTGITDERPRLQRLRVDVAGGTNRAVCYPALTGRCRIGEPVLLNTTAVDLLLGTGGAHFVVARAGKGVSVDDPSGGHIMKMRYTPLQRDVMAVEAPESPHHDTLVEAVGIEDMPVVCCGLHSQMPVVAASIKDWLPEAQVAYVMSDAASLPMAFSDTVARCEETHLVDVTITTGQAFGGAYESINLYSGLLAARHVGKADVAIVSIGPGVVGTATAFGHGGVAQGVAINAVAALGGRPIAVLRLSFTDQRERHRSVSHHTLTALSRVAMAPASVAVPSLPADQATAVDVALERAGVWKKHDRVDVKVTSLPDMRGIEPKTMGRTHSDDPAFFAAAAAAGRVAVSLVTGGER